MPLKTLVCSSGEVTAVAKAEEARKYLQMSGTLVWMDFEGVLSGTDKELLQSSFGFHDLSLEDAARPADGAVRRQRPKVEEYDDYFFLVMQALSAERAGSTLVLEPEELDVFVGGNYVVSVHRRPVPELGLVWEEAVKRPRLMACGSDRLAYHLLDAVVDHYIDIVDDIEELLDDLEDAVIDPRAGNQAVRDIFAFKRQLIGFRKAASPLREAVTEMTSREYPHVSEATQPYLRDVYDHLVRLSDMLDTYRDILAGALDVHLSAVSNNMNLVMKRLTVVATIFLPLGFITGFWGMNFTDFMPLESAFWWWGSLAVMFFLTAGMMLYLSLSVVRRGR